MIPIPFPKTSKVNPNILVTINATAGFTAGIRCDFASGTVTIDWKDGTIENFTSGVEKTHVYATAGERIAEIYGSTTNITHFAADNCKITAIANINFGMLTYFNLQTNLCSGTLDLSKLKFGTGVSNQLIANVTGANNYLFNDTETTKLLYLYINSSGLVGVVDLKKIYFAGNSFLYANGNTGLTDLKINEESTLARLLLGYCGLNTTLDLSRVTFYNTSDGSFSCNNNASLSDITFKTSSAGIINSITMSNCNLNYVNMTGFSFNRNNAYVYLHNNGMTATEVNHMLVDFDSISSAGYTGRIINIGGTNADPDGTSGGFDGLAAKTSLEGKGFTITTT
jgi:hypothetical protein